MDRKLLKAAASTLTLLGAMGFGAVTASAQAQTPATEPPAEPAPNGDTGSERIIIVGSHIQGKVTQAVPVTIVSEEQLDAIAAVSGDDLMRSIPQIGDVNFNPANNPQTTNAARGDVGSIDLRGLGVGNTLVLINGRRTVGYPTSQALSNTGSVPVISYNSNAIPTSNLERVEVLLDGGAALYGTDAVAGVVNTVTRADYDGLRLSLQYGGAEGTHLRETQFEVFGGKNFDWGNLSLSAEYTKRDALRAEDQPFTATNDLRPLFAGYPGFADSTTPDTRATRGPWPALQTPSANGVIRRGATPLTSAAGAFYIRPSSYGSCSLDLGNGICIVNRALQTTGVFRDLRYDAAVGTTVYPAVERLNLFGTGHYDINDSLQLFGELGFYTAETDRIQPPVINLNTAWIPASNYWNPFGPVTFANGQANPNRLPGLTNVPASGLPVQLTTYRFVDTGLQDVNVKDYQMRALVGLRGEAYGFDWDSAIVYAQSEAYDTSTSVSSTALQRSLALSTPDAYNPFNGGCLATHDLNDCTPSSQAAIDAIVFDLKRKTRTSLTMADFRASRSDLFELPGGSVGIAFGGEVREEKQRDNRDAHVDGQITFTDVVTGEVNGSDSAPVSANPDAQGKRTVTAAYLEFAVPLVGEQMNVPLVQSLEMQVAGRYEHYSDFGGVSKPKVAMAWDVVEGVRLRGSYSEGFRAPNLEQLNVPRIARATTSQDFYRCEADVRTGRIASFTNCGNNFAYSRQVAGNSNLEPEESVNKSFGLVLQPTFLPPDFGRITLTVDRWQVDQEGLVGILGPDATIALDYLLRLQGSSNPNVIRQAPNADDVTFFNGSSLPAAGRITQINDQYVNLLPQRVMGWDFGLTWSVDDTPLGDFDLQLNATNLDKFSRSPGPTVDDLIAARAAGEINAATPLPVASDLIRADGNPEWRASGRVTWSKGPFQVGLFTQYVSDVNETGFVDATGTPWVIDSLTTANLYFQYRFERESGWTSGTTVRVGARNITDESPPLTSEGYNGMLHRPYGRYWYVNIAKRF